MKKFNYMMLRLERLFLKDDYTIGKLYIDGSYCCDTLEDKYRDLSVEEKVYGLTCVPYGTYKVIMSFSPKFQRVMPEILNVPHFTNIRIHPGNTAKDSEGCILDRKNKVKGGLVESRFYSNMVNSLLTDAKDITITIIQGKIS